MIRPRRSLLSFIAPVALLAAGGCLATRGDVERMELTLKTMQDSARIRQSRSDSMTRTLITAATQQLQQNFTREFTSISDSVKQVAAAVQRLQGDVTLSVYDLRTQFTVVQEALGQSNKRMQEIKSSVEASAQSARPADPAAAGAMPPAEQLYSTGNKLLMSGSTGTARQNFQDLLANYPSHDRAPDAQIGVAASFASEGNRVAADSVYALVALKYPKSDAAPTALFKRARFAQEVKDTTRYRALLQEIVSKYPKSEAGISAAADLLTLKKP
jgi:TolA-binding protein